MTNAIKPKSLIHSVKQRNYSFVKFFICSYAEKIHRKVYDKQYKQDYKIIWKDKPILTLYSFLFWLYPDFRCYLKKWKPILIHAYNQKRATIKQQMSFWHIRKTNVERYSLYIA